MEKVFMIDLSGFDVLDEEPKVEWRKAQTYKQKSKE